MCRGVLIVQTMSEPKINQQVLTLAAQQHYSNLNKASCFGHFNEKGGSRLSIAPPVGEEWNTTFPEQFVLLHSKINSFPFFWYNRTTSTYSKAGPLLFLLWSSGTSSYSLKSTHNMMLVGSGNRFWNITTGLLKPPSTLQWEMSNAHQQRWCSSFVHTFGSDIQSPPRWGWFLK